MSRILVDLPEDDVKWLDRLAEEQGKSRAALLREAVIAFREARQEAVIQRFFGMWRDRVDEEGE